MSTSYASLPAAHKKIGLSLGYPAKLSRLEQVTSVNTRVAEAIAERALHDFPELKLSQYLSGRRRRHYDSFYTDMKSSYIPGPADLARVREALKHLVRDWSATGASERYPTFAPILAVLQRVPQKERTGKRVLVPGCGLGRLAWEVGEMGFAAKGCEYSWFMLLALRFLLSQEETYTIHPYAHWWSHQRSNDSLFRDVKFPDVIPRLSPNFQLFEGDFFQIGANDSGSYDYIITLFFIDTSINIVRTLEHIHSILAPGGLWINLGPLLWTSGAGAKMELSLEEVWAAARAVGFVIIGDEGDDSEGTNLSGTPECMLPRTIPCEYTHDEGAMMRWIYQAEFWVCRKKS